MASDEEGEFSPTEAARSGTGGYGALFWFTGWLFTMGYASLPWWQAMLAVFVWPFFLGMALR